MNDKLLDLLQELGKQLGVTAENLWRVLVAGQRAEGITELFIVFAVATALGIGLRGIWKMEDWEAIEPLPHFGFGLLVAGFIPLIFVLYDAIISLMAPEYMALRYILGRLR